MQKGKKDNESAKNQKISNNDNDKSKNRQGIDSNNNNNINTANSSKGTAVKEEQEELSTCKCDSLDKFEWIAEKSVQCGNGIKKDITIPLPLCPYCLGYTNGCIDIRITTISKERQNEVKKLNESYIPEDSNYGRLYEAGYNDGLNHYPSDNLKKNLVKNSAQRTFKVVHTEFGETYHIVGAMLKDENICADLNTASIFQIIFFYSIFNNERLKFDSDSSEQLAKHYSTNMLCNLFPPESDNAEISDCEAIHKYIFLRLVNLLAPKQHGINLTQKCIDYITNLGINDQKIRKVIIWIRNKKDDSRVRNLHVTSLEQLLNKVIKNDITHVILLGDPLGRDYTDMLNKCKRITFYDLTDFHRRKGFKLLMGNHNIAGQLFFLKILQIKFNAKLAIGMMSGAIDGPAFIGLPTIILTHDESPESRIPAAGKRIKTMIPIQYNEKNYIAKKIFSKSDSELIGSTISRVLKRRFVKKMKINQNVKNYGKVLTAVIMYVVMFIVLFVSPVKKFLSFIKSSKNTEQEEPETISLKNSTRNTYASLLKQDISSSSGEIQQNINTEPLLQDLNNNSYLPDPKLNPIRRGKEETNENDDDLIESDSEESDEFYQNR